MINKGKEAFEQAYSPEIKEIEVLMSDKDGAACKASGGLWTVSAYFLAYKDLEFGVLKQGEGRLTRQIPETELKKQGFSYPYFFKKGSIKWRDYRGRFCPADPNK